MTGSMRGCVSCFAAGLLSFYSASAQTVEYDITVIPDVPGSFNWIPLRLNNLGEVVGWAQYSGDPFYLRAWKWSEAGGMVLLPPPPGRDALRYGAVDINDSGMIAGDGGGDSGEAWRFANGEYTLLGTIGTNPLSTGWAINENGDMTGFSGSGSIGVAKHLYRYTDSGGMEDLLAGKGTGINDLRQISGYTAAAQGGGFEAVRIDAAGTVEFLGVLPGHNDSFANAINRSGQVVGSSRRGEGSTAFIHTTGKGMVALPLVSRWNAGMAINVHGHVLGTSNDPSRGWVWTPEKGARELNSMIDPARLISISRAYDMNDRGQIIATGGIPGGHIRVLLTPIELPCYADCDLSTGSGVLDVFDFLCFQNSFVNAEPYACDCDTSTGLGVCDVFDFLCFQDAFVAGCP